MKGTSAAQNIQVKNKNKLEVSLGFVGVAPVLVIICEDLRLPINKPFNSLKFLTKTDSRLEAHNMKGVNHAWMPAGRSVANGIRM